MKTLVVNSYNIVSNNTDKKRTAQDMKSIAKMFDDLKKIKPDFYLSANDDEKLQAIKEQIT